MSNTHGLHLVAETISGCEYEGGGNAIVRCVWGLWTPQGEAVSGTGGIGPRVSGFDIWACAAAVARETKAMLAGWRRARESCPYWLPLFEDHGGAA